MQLLPIKEIYTSGEITEVFLVFFCFILRYETDAVLNLLNSYHKENYLISDNFDAIKRGCYFMTLIFFAIGAKQMNMIFLFEKKIRFIRLI